MNKGRAATTKFKQLCRIATAKINIIFELAKNQPTAGLI